MEGGLDDPDLPWVALMSVVVDVVVGVVLPGLLFGVLYWIGSGFRGKTPSRGSGRDRDRTRDSARRTHDKARFNEVVKWIESDHNRQRR